MSRAEPAPADPAEAPGAAVLPLRFEGVSFAVGGHLLLRGLDLELGEGPRSVILGPNGSGKSLILRLCDGLIQPTAGRIRWCGPDARRVAEARALVFQRPVLLRRSAAANVDHALRLRGLPRDERERRVARVLRDTRLAGLAERPARKLSGGEQQRLALARAWATRPSVLFLDEPASSLDPVSTRELEDAIRAIQATGTKIVLTTHDLAQAERMADEILFVHDGRLLERAPADAFFAGPETKEARAFLRGEVA